MVTLGPMASAEQLFGPQTPTDQHTHHAANPGLAVSLSSRGIHRCLLLSIAPTRWPSPQGQKGLLHTLFSCWHPRPHSHLRRQVRSGIAAPDAQLTLLAFSRFRVGVVRQALQAEPTYSTRNTRRRFVARDGDTKCTAHAPFPTSSALACTKLLQFVQ